VSPDWGVAMARRSGRSYKWPRKPVGDLDLDRDRATHRPAQGGKGNSGE
jgi:hypothetical protein